MAIYGIATSSYASGLTRHHTDPGDLNGHLRDCDEAELPLLKGSVKVSRRPEWPSTGLRPPVRITEANRSHRTRRPEWPSTGLRHRRGRRWQTLGPTPGDLNGHLRDCDGPVQPALSPQRRKPRRPEWPSTGLRLFANRSGVCYHPVPGDLNGHLRDCDLSWCRHNRNDDLSPGDLNGHLRDCDSKCP